MNEAQRKKPSAVRAWSSASRPGQKVAPFPEEGSLPPRNTEDRRSWEGKAVPCLSYGKLRHCLIHLFQDLDPEELPATWGRSLWPLGE